MLRVISLPSIIVVDSVIYTNKISEKYENDTP